MDRDRRPLGQPQAQGHHLGARLPVPRGRRLRTGVAVPQPSTCHRQQRVVGVVLRWLRAQRPRGRRRAVAVRALRGPPPGRWHHEPDCQLAEQRPLGLFGASPQGSSTRHLNAWRSVRLGTWGVARERRPLFLGFSSAKRTRRIRFRRISLSRR